MLSICSCAIVLSTVHLQLLLLNYCPFLQPSPIWQHSSFKLCVVCAVGAVGYQGQQAPSQGFNMGSGMMGFGAGAVAGAALGELGQICLCSLSQYSNYTIVSSHYTLKLHSLSDREQM